MKFTIFIVLLVGLSGIFLGGKIIDTARCHAPLTAKVQREVQDTRPDISHCFHADESRDLWDCIRNFEPEDEQHD